MTWTQEVTRDLQAHVANPCAQLAHAEGACAEVPTPAGKEGEGGVEPLADTIRR